MRLAICAVIALVAAGSAGADPSIFVRLDASDLTRQTALELQRVLFLATDEAPPISYQDQVGAEADGFAIAPASRLHTGTPPYPFGYDEPSHDGYAITRQGSLSTISAGDDRALMNAVARVGESLGLGIAIDQVVGPKEKLSWAEVDERITPGSYSPSHGVRAISPQLDLSFGAAGWGVEDWFTYIDTARLSGFNTLYLDLNHETPFADVPGASTTLPAVAESTPGYGIGAYFTENDATIFDETFPVLAQPVLGRATRYGAGRGMDVVAAIEMRGNPLDAIVQKQTRARIEHLLKTYAGVSRIALRIGDPGAVLIRSSDALGRYAKAWESDFGSAHGDAARLVLFTMMVRQYAAVLDEGLVVTVGHEGEGFDDQSWKGVLSLLDIEEEATFTHGDTESGIARVTLDSNGGLWLPQDSLSQAVTGMEDVGAEGFVCSHGLMRESAMGIRFAAQRAWGGPEDTKEFLTDYVTRFFDPKKSDSVATHLNAMESSMPFNGGPSGRDGAYGHAAISYDAAAGAPFADGLAALAEEIDVVPSLHGLPGEKADAVESGIDAVLSVGTAPLRIFGGRRSSEDAFGDSLGAFYGRMFAALPLAQSMSRGEDIEVNASRVIPSLHLYAHGMRSATDLALLASMSDGLLPDSDGVVTPPESLAELTPAWLLPGRAIAFIEGDPAEARAVLRWRPLGESGWQDVPCEHLGGFSYGWRLPVEAQGIAVEYGVEVRSGMRVVASAPHGFPANTRTRVVHVANAQGRRPTPYGNREQNTFTVTPNASGTNTLAWNRRPGEDYVVVRNGATIAQTPASFFVDAPGDVGESRYELIARELASGDTRSWKRTARASGGRAPDAPDDFEIASRDGLAILTWTAADERASHYEVKAMEGDEQFTVAADAGFGMEATAPVPAEDSAAFQVTAIGPGGARSTMSPSAGIFVGASTLKPRYIVDLSSSTFFEGIAALTEAGTFIGGPGLEEGPNPTPLQEDAQLTISAWVNLDTTRGRPILVSRGLWPTPQLVVRLRDGILELELEDGARIRGGEVSAGAWHHVAIVISGPMTRVYLDGEETGRGLRGEAAPALPVLDTELPASALVTQGTIDRVAVYDVALTATELEKLSQEDPPPTPQDE